MFGFCSATAQIIICNYTSPCPVLHAVCVGRVEEGERGFQQGSFLPIFGQAITGFSPHLPLERMRCHYCRYSMSIKKREYLSFYYLGVPNKVFTTWQNVSLLNTEIFYASKLYSSTFTFD